MQREEALRIIAVYEDSIERPDAERFVVADEDGRLFESEPIAMLPHADTVIEEYARRCKDYLRYGLELEACLEGRLGRYDAVTVRSDTPPILQKVGFRDLPLCQTQKHLKNEVAIERLNSGNPHAMPLAVAKAVPELLERPVAVFEDWQGRGVVAALDALDARGNPVVVPLGPAGLSPQSPKRAPANFVLSVYGRSNFRKFLDRQLFDHNVLYMDAKRMGRLLSCAGQQLPRACRSLSDIVRQSPTVTAVNEGRVPNKQRQNGERWSHDRKDGSKRRARPVSLAERIARADSASDAMRQARDTWREKEARCSAGLSSRRQR